VLVLRRSCLPYISLILIPASACLHTMWSGNLAPNDSNLRSSNLLLRTVNESNLLSKVEAEIMSAAFIDL
jgi:hypothetical protein